MYDLCDSSWFVALAQSHVDMVVPLRWNSRHVQHIDFLI